MDCLIRLVIIPIVVGGMITGYLWTYRSDCKKAVPCAQPTGLYMKRTGGK